MKVFAYTEVASFGNVSTVDEGECVGELLMGFCQAELFAVSMQVYKAHEQI